MASFIPYVVALILAVNAVNGLRCYSCNSKDSTTCRWGITSFTYNTEECATAGFLDGLVGAKCYKMTARNKEGAEYIARGCLNPPAIGCSAMATAVGWISDHSSSDPQSVSDINCVTCDTEKCNSASKITGFTFLGLLLAAFAFLF